VSAVLEALLVLALAILGAAHAACDQPFVNAVFIPPSGATDVPSQSELAVVVYGDFGIDFDFLVDADGVDLPGPMPTAKRFQVERPDPGGLFVFKPYAALDTNALHTMRLLYMDEPVASSTFEVSNEVIRPMGTTPLVEITNVSGEQDRNDSCGARTVRDVSIDVAPADNDPLEVSYLEIHLVPEGSGVNDDTIYDVIPVPADDSMLEVELEVPADVAEGACITAFQVNGAGEESGVARLVCLDDWVAPSDDKKCGCTHATPMGGALSVLGMALVAARRRARPLC
jgi:hypothetical protein